MMQIYRAGLVRSQHQGIVVRDILWEAAVRPGLSPLLILDESHYAEREHDVTLDNLTDTAWRLTLNCR